MLDGKRIYLRLLEKEDLKLRVDWINDEENSRTLMFDWPTSLAKTESWFNNTMFDKSKCNLTIVDKETDKAIGMTGLIDIDYRHLRAQFYITIGDKDFRGLKLPDEIIPLVLSYAFSELGLKRVFLHTLPNNDKARKIYERNGFISEGIMRRHFFSHGQYNDLHIHSILFEDWIKNQ